MCSACGAAGAIGQRRHIIGVDDVVREAGVVAVLCEQLLEDRAGLQLAVKGLVGRIRGEGQRQRVENRRLVV
jgi:hypothetical protein